MRILFATGSLVHGGAERHSITLMNRLAERGHECHAVYVKNDPSQLDRIRLGTGGTVRCLGATRFLDRQAVAEFARRIVALQPSIIVAANPYAHMYAVLARRRAGLRVPLVVTFHSTKMQGLREHTKMLIDRLFLLAADCLVFVCEEQRRYWRRRGLLARRIEVIHNGVDATHFQPGAFRDEAARLRRDYGIADTECVFGMVAVLRPEKNHTQLLEAIAALRKQGVAAHALLIGDGVMRAAIEACARLLGIERFVTITGFQNDVRPFIAACDAVVLCSVTEAFSLAAVEAMAMGKPVVHSNVGGAPEMIDEGVNGFLFPVSDTAALVDCLARLATGSLARRMGSHARTVVDARFSERAMLDRYEALLLELTHTRPAMADASASAHAHPAGGIPGIPHTSRSE